MGKAFSEKLAVVSLIQSNIARYFEYSNSLIVPVSDVANGSNAMDEKAVPCQPAYRAEFQASAWQRSD